MPQLQAFVAVARALSFSAAAKQVHLSQPALSASIRKLEDAIGARLFDRDTRNVALTPAGSQLLAVCDRLLNDVDEAFAGVRAFVAGKRGRLSVAASPSLAAHLVPRVLCAFQREYPLVELRVHDALAEDAIELVRVGKADLALAAETSVETDLSRQVFASDRLVLVCAPDHPLARKASVRWRDLIGQPLIAQKSSSSVRRRLEAAWGAHGEALRPAFEVEYSTTLCSFVAHGLGVGVLPESLVPTGAPGALTVRRIVQPEIRRPLCVYRLASRTPSPAAAAFVEMCIRQTKRGR